MLLHQYMNGALEVMHPTALQKDTTFTKIFVGGLPYHTNDASLRKYFEAFGDIDEAVVITDRQTGKSRGYGFVSTRTRLIHNFWESASAVLPFSDPSPCNCLTRLNPLLLEIRVKGNPLDPARGGGLNCLTISLLRLAGCCFSLIRMRDHAS